MISGSITRFLLLLAGSAISLAATPAWCELPKIELGLGSSYELFLYKEQLDAPQKSTETAAFPTLLTDARVYFGAASYFRVRYEAAFDASSIYDGTSLDGTQSVTTTDTLSFISYEAALYFALTDRITVYGAYGSRAWNRFLSGGAGYRELYTWTYTPIGAQYFIVLDNEFDLAVDASYRPTSNGKIQVITSETYSGGQDSQMNLGAKPGWRVAVPMRWRWGDWSLRATPYFEHSEIGQSNAVVNTTLSPQANTVIHEPDSKTDRLGVEGLVTYTF